MKKLSIVCVSIMFLFVCKQVSIYSQINNMSFDHISLTDGLSQSSINTITQDNYGFIWLGTHEGLNRYDGFDFKIFKNNPQKKNSISNNQVLSLYTDSRGYLWVGTGGGLNIYIPEYDRFINNQNSNDILDGLNNKDINCILEDSKGVLWIGASDGLYKGIVNGTANGVAKFSFEKVNNIYYQYLGLNYTVKAIVETRNKEIVIGSMSGLYKVDQKSNCFVMVDALEANYKTITTICQQNDSVFWFGTIENGLYQVTYSKNDNTIPVKSKSFVANGIQMKRISALLIDRFNNLWIASRNGLVKYNTCNNNCEVFLSNPIDNTSLSDNRLNCLYEDKSGVLFIGSESQGLNKLDLYRKEFFTIKHKIGDNNSLSDNYISAIHGSIDGAVYIGYDGNGIDELRLDDQDKVKVKNISNNYSFASKNILSLYHDKAGKLWFGSTMNGLGVLDTKKNTLNYNSHLGYVFSIYEDSKCYLWTGTWSQGLYMYNKENGETFNFVYSAENKHSIGGNTIISLFEDSNHTLWIGTKGAGVNRVKIPVSVPGNAVFERYMQTPDDTSSLSHNDVFCILQDKQGTIWIGTGAGLNKCIIKSIKGRETIGFKTYLEKDGLPSGVIYGILEDNSGNLWMSTNKGLSKFNIASESFTNYDVNDGLQSNEFHLNDYYKDARGRMYFGGVGGLTFFHPDSISENPFSPSVLFTNLKIQGKNVSINDEVNGDVLLSKTIFSTKELELKYSDREISLEFAAMHYTNPEKNQYKYRLLGFNDEWQIVSSRFRSVTYTNLNQGKYVFQVMASNNDGKWSDNINELKIVVLPPPWKTIWAYLLYVVLIITIFYLFKKYSLIADTKKKKLLVDSIEKDKIEELTRLKIQFFTNISHELRTPLTLINSPVEELLSNKKLESNMKQQLSTIHRNTQRLLMLVNQLLEFRKIDSGQTKLNISKVNIIDLVNEIYTVFDQYAMTRHINFHFIHIDQEIILFVDKEKLITVLFNLLSNAFKFSKDKSAITIELSLHKQDGATNTGIENSGTNQNSYVEIKIIDEGPGISKEFQDKIFQRFYQVSGSQDEGKPGTGIGLAIAREYIEMQGGTITVKSEQGKGSTFIINLKLGDAHLKNFALRDSSIREEKIESAIDDKAILKKQLSAMVSSMQSPLTEEHSSDKPSILIVEDNNELLEYLASKFSPKYRVIKADNGTKGLEMAKLSNPDLVITDIMMPGIDGLELCKKLKNDLNTSHIPVIILTAKSTVDTNIESLEAGAEVFIQKPFSIDVLKAQVKATIEARKKLHLNFSKKLILQPKEIAVTSVDERFLKKLMEVVEKNLSDPNFGIKELTQEMNMSHSVLFRKIKSLTGSNIVEFIRSVRIKKAALILKKGKMPISELGLLVGFNDSKYFSKCFVNEFGITPTEYAANKKAENANLKSSS